MTEPTHKIHKRQQEIYLMRKSGMNFREIGEKLDVSSARARNVYHETSLKIRINELESHLKRRGEGGDEKEHEPWHMKPEERT